MKKTICLLCTLILCLWAVCPMRAAADTFVPSISYKDTPTIEETEMNGEDTGSCLRSVSIATARKHEEDPTPQEKELLEVYEQLMDGSMEQPISEEHVIRELIHVYFDDEECVKPPHGHKEWLEEEDNPITLRFDLGVEPETDVIILVFKNGEWIPAEGVTNNGDGTVTVTLEDIGTIAFCIPEGTEVPKTGDSGFLLWAVILVACAGGIVALLLLRRKKK